MAVSTALVGIAPVAATTVAVDLRCTGCGACLVTCPERALVAAPRRPLVIVEQCTSCLACVEVCPAGAIREVPVP